jgi:hypothetical protein
VCRTISHRNLLRYYGYALNDDKIYVVTELLRGGGAWWRVQLASWAPSSSCVVGGLLLQT